MKHQIAYIGLFALAACALTSCDSGDNEFPDYAETANSAVYFANQQALRTLEQGEDEYVDLTLDSQNRVRITATWGGGYTTRNNVVINCTIDPTLLDGKKFADGRDIELMPEAYYTLASNTINIPAGQILGGLDVQLTDAFFADPKSATTNYVIPVRMTGVQGADSILENKDYVLYCVKYANPYQGQYLRRGVDINNGMQKVRHQTYVKDDEVVNISTVAQQTNVLPLTVKDAGGVEQKFSLRLNFAADGTCTISSDDAVASGTGHYAAKGEKNSLGGKDRNAIYLDYTVTVAGMDIATKDTLVLRTRNVLGAQTFDIAK